MKWRHLPNIITAFRLLMVFPFLYCTLDEYYTFAFFIFILASISDGLDGFLARHFQWQSQLGAFGDPLADKFLVISSYIALALNHQIPWWFATLMVTRDVVIMGGAASWYFFFRKIEFQPTVISKTNTVFQLMLIIVVLFQLSFHQLPIILIQYLIILTTLTTAFSFVDYVVRWGVRAFFQRENIITRQPHQ